MLYSRHSDTQRATSEPLRQVQKIHYSDHDGRDRARDSDLFGSDVEGPSRAGRRKVGVGINSFLREGDVIWDSAVV